MEAQEIVDYLKSKGFEQDYSRDAYISQIVGDNYVMRQEIERLKKWNRTFYGNVKEMRELQVHDPDKAREKEQEVDAEISRIESIILRKSEQQ